MGQGKERKKKEKGKIRFLRAESVELEGFFLFLRAEFREMGPRNPYRLGGENSVEDSEAEKTFLNLFAERRGEVERTSRVVHNFTPTTIRR